MADDITLTVRVRDMTRGEFNQIRQRMRGMGGEVRRISRDTQGATQSADRFANSLTGLQRRLSQFQRTGSTARYEMDFMRRSMGLLGRDLRRAAVDGELTEDQFRDLRNELERTRLDFDHLGNTIRRQDDIAQRTARRQAARQREAARQQREAAREETRLRREAERASSAERRRQEADARAIVAMRRRLATAHAAALREEMQRNLRAEREAERQAREELRRQQVLARGIVAERRRIAQAHAAALREEAQRNQRAERERQRAAAAAAAAQRREVGRLAGLGGGDQGLAVRFRALGTRDMDRMTRSFASLQRAMAGISGGSARAQRSVRVLGGDLRTMSAALRQAQDAGMLSRREFNALSNGLRQATRDMRLLRRSGDLTRSSFRDMRRDVMGLQAQLRLLGREGNVFSRLADRTLLLQRRLRETREHAGFVRRTLSRLGEGALGGMNVLTRGLGRLLLGLSALGGRFSRASRFAKLFLLALLLLAPAASALGALLVTALGGAFIALGAFALKGTASVKSAFRDMKSTVASSVREAARPMEEDLADGIHQVGIAISRMQPLLTAAFTASGPLVEDFVGAFTDLAALSMPGIITALQDMGPAMEGFRTAMGMVGQGFGDMFAAMTEQGGAEALADVWVTVGRELANLLEGIGQFINAMSRSGTATMILVGVFRSLSGILNTVQVGIAIVDTMFGGLFQHINDNVIGLDGLAGGIDGIGTSFVASGQSAGELKKQLKDVNKEISRIKKVREAEDTLLGMPEHYYEEQKATEEDLKNAQTQRKALLEAISAAEGDAASSTRGHAAAVADLIAKISSLNDLNRSALDARSAQEQAIDDAAKGTTKYSDALKMTKGQLDLSEESGRKAYEMLSRIASTTKEATDAAIKQKAPWEQVRQQWKSGYDEVVRLADGMGLSAEDAKRLADQIVGIPSKDIFLKVRTEEAISNLNSVIAAFQAAPDKKTVTVEALASDAITTLTNLGFVVTQMPDGSFQITAETEGAKTKIGALKAARDGLKGKKIKMVAEDASSGVIKAIKELIETLQDRTITVTTVHRTVLETFVNPQGTAKSLADAIRKQAKNAGASGGLAHRLPRRFADGGSTSGDVLEGPGTKTSDSLLARLSRGEFVMRASAVDKYGVAFMKTVNEGRLPRFAKGGMSDTMKQARSEIRGLVTLSAFGAKAGYKNTEIVKALGLPDSLKELVSSLNKWRSLIKQATSGGVEKNLLKKLSSAGKALTKYEKQHEKIAKTLEKAKALRESVRTGVISATNITRGVTDDKQLTVAGIMQQMTEGRDKAVAFAKALRDLRKKGVNKTIIKQIAEAGIEGGGLETAGALLSASSSEIVSINKLQSEINKNATKAGNAAADAMYSAGKKAGEGLIAGLEKQQKAIEKAMMKIAKSMEKAIKKALGIKSPSKVMQEVGHFAAEGFAVGVKNNAAKDEAWASMLPAGPSMGGTAAASYGGMSGGPTVLNVYIGEKKVDEIVLDSNRRTVRTRGGNVQAVFGRKDG